MGDDEDRSRVSIRLSAESRDGWEQACLKFGITMTAYIEAIGLELVNYGVATEAGQRVIDLARQIDAERRARR